MKTASLLAIVLIASAAAVRAADGDPDLSFAGGTLTSQSVPTTQFENYDPAAVLAADGSVLVASVAGLSAASTATRFAVTKFRSDGSIDSGFGEFGLAQVDFSNGAADYPAYAHGIAAASEGRWLVAGRVGPSYNIGLARLGADGSLDASYGNQGRVRLDLGGQELLLEMQIDAQQRAWLLVERGGARTLLRLTADGALDAGFAGGGKLSLPNDTSAVSFAFDAQGRILLGGVNFTSTTRFAMAVRRLLPDGSSDRSFGEQGLALIAPDVRATADKLRVQADGRILLVGTSYAGNWVGSGYGRLTVARLLDNGQLDTGYANDGIGFVDFAGNERSRSYPGLRVALGADGKLTIARAVYDPAVAIRLARLLPSGQPDASFAVQGRRSLLQNVYGSLALGQVLVTPTRLLIAGTYVAASTRAFFAGAWHDGDGIFRSGLQ